MRYLWVASILVVACSCQQLPSAFVTTLVEMGGVAPVSAVWALSDDGVPTYLWNFSMGGIVSCHAAFVKDGWLYFGLGSLVSRFKYADPDPWGTEEDPVIVDWDLQPWRVESVSVAGNTLWYTWDGQAGGSHLEAKDLTTEKVKCSIALTDADGGSRTPGIGLDEDHWAFASRETKKLHICSASAAPKTGRDCPAVTITGIPEDHQLVDVLDITFSEKTGDSVLLYMSEWSDVWAALGSIDAETAMWKYDGHTPLWQVPMHLTAEFPGESFPEGFGYEPKSGMLWLDGFREGVIKGKAGETMQILPLPASQDSWPIALCVNNDL